MNDVSSPDAAPDHLSADAGESSVEEQAAPAPVDEAGAGAAPTDEDIADHEPDDPDAVGDFTDSDIDLSHLEVEDDEDGGDTDD